mgnify:CR=1 FL=1
MVSKGRGQRWTGAGQDPDNGRAAGANVEARPFELVSDFQMTGDQPNAVARLAEGVKKAQEVLS